MQRPALLLLAVAALATPALAATLYRWTDASGITRFGYQPPPGVTAVPAEEDRQALYQEPAAPPIRCEDLAREHLAVIDREIARVKAMPAGLGPEFELTPAARQQLVLDLLAHRAALITGRSAEEFRTLSPAEIQRNQARLQTENMQLQNQLRSSETALATQQNRLDRTRRELAVERVMPHLYGPGYLPWPATVLPVPIRR